jgi:hypothetical protein
VTFGKWSIVRATVLMVLSMVGLASTSRATTITFTFGSEVDSLTEISQTVDGVTLTISNADAPVFHGDGTGLAVFGLGSWVTLSSFEMTFSSAVRLISYTVGYTSGPDAFGVLTLTAGASASVENGPFVLGSRNFANQFTVNAGQTIAVTTTALDSAALLQWKSLTVETVTAPDPEPAPVPEPGVLVLVGLALATVAVKRGRARA